MLKGIDAAFVNLTPRFALDIKGSHCKAQTQISPLSTLRATDTQNPAVSNPPSKVTIGHSVESPVSSYQGSSGLVKGIVSGLTAMVNSIMNKELEESEEVVQRDPLTPQELYRGIQGDYERLYLWTGDIDPALYDASCVFTDPTLSFKGLATFQKNLANLRPIIDRLVTEYDVELYSCELDEPAGRVTARWRMIGSLALPWSPVIDLQGTTNFRYESGKGNRIVDYFETWETPAGTVLLNLFKPGARGAKPSSSTRNSHPRPGRSGKRFRGQGDVTLRDTLSWPPGVRDEEEGEGSDHGETRTRGLRLQAQAAGEKGTRSGTQKAGREGDRFEVRPARQMAWKEGKKGCSAHECGRGTEPQHWPAGPP
eukprot:CAMPEP_0196726476 /NCGR_PEP_ID=MMETSP1091-20130531/7743_1 /TAXON_ID=302021 /ORGANISM="Rhodomonas sp., Strain CCMP768" /LENGTH=367 /DNA_ID=CAMNT_0042068925 /DNA_START=74 /DNA_END=1179 /DNA_ORIENTATION=-